MKKVEKKKERMRLRIKWIGTANRVGLVNVNYYDNQPSVTKHLIVKTSNFVGRETSKRGKGEKRRDSQIYLMHDYPSRVLSLPFPIRTRLA